MSTARRIIANRANARASSGPKTARGKAHSARNALGHGLSLPVLADPALSQEVEAAACEIAGAGATPELHALARPIAEALIDLCRVRWARQYLLSTALCDPDYASPATKRTVKFVAAADKISAQLKSIPDRTLLPSAIEMGLTPGFIAAMHRWALMRLRKYTQSRPEGPQKLATILADNRKQLAALDRYERRALSRRKFAIRAFDAARARKIASTA